MANWQQKVHALISSRYPNPQCELVSDALLSLSPLLLRYGYSYPNASKEIHRAVKEAEIYLGHCSSWDWPIKYLIRSATGEAYSLHLHDLALCYQLLDVMSVLLPDRRLTRTKCESYQETHRSIKMDHDCGDKVQLIKTCEQFAERSIHTIEDQNIVKISKFLGGKLKGTIPIPVSSEVQYAVIPTWLELDPADLVLDRERGLGDGSFGHVYEGSWLGLRVAAKEMYMDSVSISEALIHAKLQNPFIVHLIGTCIKDSRLYLVMEFVGSNLEKIIEDRSKKERTPFSLPVAVDIMLQISRAMEYLHTQNIMHLDLKASNILFELSSVPELREEGYGRVKLCDFGTASTRLFSFRAQDDTKGTTFWRAPEVFQRSYDEETITTPETYTYKADVYSFAMACYEILTGKQPFAPFADVPSRELYKRIMNGERPTLKPSICPSILVNYIQQCWSTDPDCRPCFEAVSHFLRMLKVCNLMLRFDWKEALNRRINPDFGFVDGEKKSIFFEKLKKWKDESLVGMHSGLVEMLCMYRSLTFKMRREIAIDIASFLATIHKNSAKGFLGLSLCSRGIYLDWKLKPIFSGVPWGRPLSRLGQGRKEAKRYEEFKNIQEFGRISVELCTGYEWKDMPFSIASLQRWIECSEFLKFVDRQLVEETEKMGERQLWEVVRWCKLGLWCLSKSPSQQPNIQTVLQFLKEATPIDLTVDSTLRDYLSPIPTIENVKDPSRSYVDPFPDEEAVMLEHAWDSFVPRPMLFGCFILQSLDDRSLGLDKLFGEEEQGEGYPAMYCEGVFFRVILTGIKIEPFNALQKAFSPSMKEWC